LQAAREQARALAAAQQKVASLTEQLQSKSDALEQVQP